MGGVAFESRHIECVGRIRKPAYKYIIPYAPTRGDPPSLYANFRGRLPPPFHSNLSEATPSFYMPTFEGDPLHHSTRICRRQPPHSICSLSNATLSIIPYEPTGSDAPILYAEGWSPSIGSYGMMVAVALGSHHIKWGGRLL